MDSPRKSIITHGGPTAHRDDFMACSILLAADPSITGIIRREPSAEELASTDIYVVDVGGQYNHELLNYDHHQFDRDHEPTCALSLVLKHYVVNLYPDFERLNPWVEYTEVLDSKGAGRLMEWFGIPQDGFNASSSPIEKYILTQFAGKTSIGHHNPLIMWMRSFGQSILDGAKAYTDAYDDLMGEFSIFDIGVEKGKSTAGPANSTVVSGLAIGRSELTDKHRPQLTRIANAFRAKELDKTGRQVAISIMPDDRGAGYSLFRYDDDKRVDFSRLEDNPAILFAHKGGFVAKTKEPVEGPILMDLCLSALVN